MSKEEKTMNFDCSVEQVKKYEKWRKKLPKLPEAHFGAVGGGYTFSFIPTGIGTIVSVTRKT